MATPQLSIVIPAYNESARIGQTLERVMACVERQGWDAEVLVVDDGSADRTVEIVRRWMERFPRLHLIQNEGNRGKGYRVRNGLLQAAGEVVMFTDADLSAPMEEAERLLAAIREGADVAIGSRWMDQHAADHPPAAVPQVLRAMLQLGDADGDGAAVQGHAVRVQGVQAQAAQVIFRLQRIERWGFDPEILFIARKLGYTIREVPVTWGHDERSRMSYLRDGMKMLEEMAAIRGNSIAGRYDRDIAALKDTSTMVTPPAKQGKTSPSIQG